MTCISVPCRCASSSSVCQWLTLVTFSPADCNDLTSCTEGWSCTRRLSLPTGSRLTAHPHLRMHNGMTCIAVPCRSGFSSSASQKPPSGYGRQSGLSQASQQPLQWPRRQRRASSLMPTYPTFLTLSSSQGWTRLCLVSRAGCTWSAGSVAFK